MLQVTINGQRHACAEEQTIFAALSKAGARVPALCHDARLAPLGGCRLCLVELRGQSRPVAACTTPLVEGMEIITHSETLEQLRRTQLRLLARQYPKPAAEQEPTNDFLRLVRAYDLEGELAGHARPELIDDSHACIHVDMSRCIHCFRCVRICEEVAGRFVWQVWNRSDRTEIRPAGGGSLRESECVSCGACVDTCPSGALLDKNRLGGPPVSTEVRTVCPYCGTGCEMYVGAAAGRLASVRPVPHAPVNKGHLCVKGRYGWDFVHAPDRITEPMLRQGNTWRTVPWAEALAFVAERLRSLMDRYGPPAVGMLGSARATNEENYVAQKFARVVMGNNNVDCCARVCHAPTAAGMKLMLGTGAATNSFDDLEQARTLLLCGVNPTENHPIVGDRIKQAVRRGAALIVIDPRRIELAHVATLHLQLRAGTNIPLLNALAHTIVEERLFHAGVVPSVFENWPAYADFLAAYAPERVAAVCGVSAELIRQAARLYATQGPAMCFHGLGVTEHGQGTEGVMCLVNLALITGNLGRPASGVNPLRGQNNVQGSAHMGCDPGILTGSVPVGEHRARFESIWQAPVPERPGLNLMHMLDAAQRGEFHGLWVMGYDLGLSHPNASSTWAALQKLELVVVQDLFLTETARLAGTVFLPACSSFEKEGTFMNSERRIQRVRRVIEPLGNSRTDWEVLCQVAQALGQGQHFSWRSAEDIWNEIRSVWPAGAGITYSRLEQGGLQWPCPTEDHPGTAVLHTHIFANGPRIKLRTVEYRPTAEQTCAEYPFLLTTGRALYQFNAGTMTGRSRAGAFQPDDFLQISPADAQQLGISEGQRIRLTSRYGTVEIAATITQAVCEGELFATFQSNVAFVNQVTSTHRDRFVMTPEYKVTAVRIET